MAKRILSVVLTTILCMSLLPIGVLADEAVETVESVCVDHVFEIIAETPPTCTEYGYLTYACQNEGCAEGMTQELTPLGHSYGEAIVTVEATCMGEGEISFTCPSCNESVTEITPVLDHCWDEGTVIKEITAEEPGEILYTCTVCSAETSVLIEAGDENEELDGEERFEPEDDYFAPEDDYEEKEDVMDDGEISTEPASGTCGEGVTWTYDSGLLTISGNGEMDGFTFGEAYWYGIQASICRIVIEEGVTRIDEAAFYNLWNLESVTIPRSVKSIGAHAFACCWFLDSVKYAGSEEEWYEIAIEEDNSILLRAAPYAVRAEGTCGENVTWVLENGVLTVSGTGPMADIELQVSMSEESSAVIAWSEYAEFIEKVVIEEGVTRIGKNAFANCGKLTDVQIANTVESIGGDAFLWCWNLVEVTVPDSVKTIESYAFSENGIVSISLGKGITTIESYAFCECYNLGVVLYAGSEEEWAAISVGDRNEDLTEGAEIIFGYTPGSEVIIVSGVVGEDITWTLSNTGVLTISGSGDVSGRPGWWSYRGLVKSVIVEEGVTSVGAIAFGWMENLKEVSLPNTIASIEYSTFLSCTALTKLDIPDSVVSIGEAAFASTGLTSIDIPDNVAALEYSAFRSCYDLVEVDLPENLVTIGESVFSNCVSIEEIELPVSLEEIGGNAFNGCVALSDVYYDGTLSQWNSISIASGNGFILNANVHLQGVTASDGKEENAEVLESTVQTLIDSIKSGEECGVKLGAVREDVDIDELVNGDADLRAEPAIRILNESSLSEEAVEKLVNADAEDGKDTDLALVLDVNLPLVADGEIVGYIGETEEELEFSVTLSDEQLAEIGVGIENLFVVRLHNGQAEKLETYTKEGEPNKIYFKTNRFSIYAVAFDWVLGDINNNGSIAADDLVSLMKYVLGSISAVKNAADMNGDGTVDILDVICLVRNIAGITDKAA